MFGEMVFLEAQSSERHRSQWSRVSSVALQAMAVSALFLYSLLRVEPPQPLTITAPPPQFVPPQVMKLITHPEQMLGSVSNAIAGPAPARTITVPRSIPHGVASEAESPEPALPIGAQACILCASTGANNVLRSVLGNGGSGTAVRAAPPTKPLKISHLDQGRLLTQVQPVYPMPAKAARVQGEVVLHAIIARDGTIESLRVERGSPLLTRAALDAVRQWRYRPYILNGQRIEVETEITVNFRLGG